MAKMCGILVHHLGDQVFFGCEETGVKLEIEVIDKDCKYDLVPKYIANRGTICVEVVKRKGAY